MQVILTKPIRKLGKVGDEVTVSGGYGRNYLIPQSFAVRATKENIERFESLRRDLEKKNLEQKQKAEELCSVLEGKILTFVTQSAADGRLFGSISSKSIAMELSKVTNSSLNYSNVELVDPIKFNGVYKVVVNLHAEVSTSVLVVVAKTDSEAQDALDEYRKSLQQDNKKDSKNNSDENQEEK